MVYVPPPVRVRIAPPSKPLPRRRMEGDWLAMDEVGSVALFSGADAGAIPVAADPERTIEALLALDTAATAHLATSKGGYRALARHKREPVFDLPIDQVGHPLHEDAYDGYPHLVFASDAVGLRQATDDLDARDVLSRTAFALVVPALSSATHALLHEERLCVGCRVIDPLDDPRPRAPELVAAAGIHAFVHPADVPEGLYVRVASPAEPADREDLEAVVLSIAELVRLPIRFDQARSLDPRQLVACEEIADE